jgi:DNA-binding response OmpR family regulator
MAEKKVLVVDDEVHIIHVVTIKLRNNGYEVISQELEIAELLGKPFSPKELLRSVDDILYQKEVMRDKW